jgi:hypothetical protein
MNYAFLIHLFPRWFASACNVLMALSLAINLARLEGENSRRKESLTTLRIRLVSYCLLCLCGWSLTIWTQSVILLHVDIMWRFCLCDHLCNPLYLPLIAMTMISTTLCKSQQWFWDCDGLHNGHFEFVIKFGVVTWHNRSADKIIVFGASKITQLGVFRNTHSSKTKSK